MNLTREQAIVEHRKMYNKMADKIEKNKSAINVFEFEEEYCLKNGFSSLNNFSFICDYSYKNFSVLNCDINCPLIWGMAERDSCMKCGNNPGLYKKMLFEKDWKEQASLARQIANLPERTDV